MSLPTAWVEKIFDKLTLNYGVDFMARYKGIPLQDVKTDWSHELGFAVGRPSCISYALSNLPERPPTAQQFKALCLNAPNTEVPAALLPQPAPNPERMRFELEKLSKPVPAVDPRDWARKILANPAGRTPTVLQMARNALEN